MKENQKKLYEEPSAEALERFEKHCGILDRSSTYSRLEPLSTRYTHVISNLRFSMPERHNDRYLDNWFKAWDRQNLVRPMGVVIVGALMPAFSPLMLSLGTEGKFEIWYLLFTAIALLIVILALLMIVRTDLTPIRFNRQAQLVHMYVRRKWYRKPELVTVPWKSVRAYVQDDMLTIATNARLHLVFPGQESVMGDAEPLVPWRSELCLLHAVASPMCLAGYELIRRYMEMGIDAIQDYDIPESGVTIIEEGHREARGMVAFINILSLGVSRLVDKYYENWRENFRWPAEIEALSSTDAREKGLLENYDTAPVIPQVNINAGQVWGTAFSFSPESPVRDRYIDEQRGMSLDKAADQQ